MSTPRSRSLAALILLAWATQPALAEDALRSALLQASQGGHYTQATASELRAARAIFASILAAPERAPAETVLDGLGLRVLAISAPQPFVLLQEREDNKRGRGFLALRPHSGSALMLQMPHSFKDELTRDIGLALFDEGRAAAAVWNTVPRRYPRGGTMVDADMAHLDGTYFQVLSEAWSEARPRSYILQLHGFAQDKRRSRVGSAADAIISSGGTPTPEVVRMARCLRQSLVPTLRVYPVEVDELGGTTNRIGQTLRARGYPGFIHLELSRPLRERLAGDAAARKQLLECLPE